MKAKILFATALVLLPLQYAASEAAKTPEDCTSRHPDASKIADTERALKRLQDDSTGRYLSDKCVDQVKKSYEACGTPPTSSDGLASASQQDGALQTAQKQVSGLALVEEKNRDKSKQCGDEAQKIKDVCGSSFSQLRKEYSNERQRTDSQIEALGTDPSTYQERQKLRDGSTRRIYLLNDYANKLREFWSASQTAAEHLRSCHNGIAQIAYEQGLQSATTEASLPANGNAEGSNETNLDGATHPEPKTSNEALADAVRDKVGTTTVQQGLKAGEGLLKDKIGSVGYGMIKNAAQATTTLMDTDSAGILGTLSNVGEAATEGIGSRSLALAGGALTGGIGILLGSTSPAGTCSDLYCTALAADAAGCPISSCSAATTYSIQSLEH